MGFLLFLQVLLEFENPPLQVRVDVDVARNDALHATHVLIDVVLDGTHALHVGDQLTLFSEELGSFLEVLEMAVEQLFLLLDDPINFLVEG